jgi:hypothetical protein
MREDIICRITKEIRQSGFPLELYCLNICSKRNTARLPNIRYVYEGNLKEIDLYVFFEGFNFYPRKGENLQHTSTSLVIECKKSNNPWVFFSSKVYGSQDVFSFAKYVSSFDSYFAEIKKPDLRSQIHNKLKKNHYKYNKGVPYCLSYFEAFKKHDAPSEIYKAVESVLSYLNFRIQSRKSGTLKRQGYYTEFLYPVIVLDGSLFSTEIREDQIHVKKSDHVQLRVDYKNDLYFVDVVTKENFESFFNMIENDHYDFVESINALSFPEDFQYSLKKRKEVHRTSNKSRLTR